MTPYTFGAELAKSLNTVAGSVKSAGKLGLWDRIRMKRQRGEKPAKPGDKDYPDSKSWNKVTAESEKKAGTPAWQRSEGKNEEGGLNAKGRASYNRATGGNLKAPVTESNPKGDRAKRQNSFCSRMCGMKKHETGSKTKKDPDSRINKALRKWNCKCGTAKTAGDNPAFIPFGGGPMIDSLLHQNKQNRMINSAASSVTPNLMNMIGKRLGFGVGPALSFGATLGHAGVSRGLNTQKEMLQMFQQPESRP